MEFVPLSEEKYFDQKQQLIDLQTRHSHVLQREGIAARALTVMRPQRRNLIGLLPTRLVVQRQKENIPDSDEVITRSSLCFLSMRQNSLGQSSLEKTVVPVSEIYHGMQLSAPGFTSDDAKTVEEMVLDLEHYRDSGLLPNLNEACTDIAYATPLPEIHIPPVP